MEQKIKNIILNLKNLLNKMSDEFVLKLMKNMVNFIYLIQSHELMNYQ